MEKITIRECQYCDGEGMDGCQPCYVCNGKGTIAEEESSEEESSEE